LIDTLLGHTSNSSHAFVHGLVGQAVGLLVAAAQGVADLEAIDAGESTVAVMSCVATPSFIWMYGKREALRGILKGASLFR